MRVWDAASGREVQKLEGHPAGVYSVAWSAVGSDAHGVELYELCDVLCLGMVETEVFLWADDSRVIYVLWCCCDWWCVGGLREAGACV